jgi:hypothetical protein
VFSSSVLNKKTLADYKHVCTPKAEDVITPRIRMKRILLREFVVGRNAVNDELAEITSFQSYPSFNKINRENH